MIECTSKKIYKKHKKRKFLSIFLAIILFLCFFFFYRFVLSENIYNTVNNIAYSYAQNCINQTILNEFSGISYNDISIVERDSQNEITYISFKTNYINVLCRDLTEKINSNLNKILNNGFEIPFFAFTGIKFFSGYGWKVNFKSFNLLSNSVNLTNEYLEGGINQTLHSIFAEIKTEISIEIPFNRKISEINTKILISQSMIIGKVPNIVMRT